MQEPTPRLAAALLAVACTGLALSLTGCATAKKKTPELSKLLGKKIALTEIAGEETPKKIIEVALVNQLLEHGSFVLVSKQDVEAARKAPDIDPTNLLAIAKRAGADYSLRAEVLQFDAETHEGYSSEEVEDSQLAEERGDGKTQRYFKAKSIEAKVRVALEFRDVSGSDVRTGEAEAEDRVVEEAKTKAIHLPPKLRFLETLSNRAFKEFFERYH